MILVAMVTIKTGGFYINNSTLVTLRYENYLGMLRKIQWFGLKQKHSSTLGDPCCHGHNRKFFVIKNWTVFSWHIFPFIHLNCLLLRSSSLSALRLCTFLSAPVIIHTTTRCHLTTKCSNSSYTLQHKRLRLGLLETGCLQDKKPCYLVDAFI